MKNILLFILYLSLVGCNSDKKTTKIKTEPELITITKKLNSKLIGVYEFKTHRPNWNHYIVIDTTEQKLIGLYYGTVDNSDGHGVDFYVNEMENLNFENNKISFEIGKRNLKESTQFKIVKYKRDFEKDTTIRISKNRLKYSGEISNNGFELNCESEFNDCWQSFKMTFNRIVK